MAKYHELPPDAGRVITSLRDSGYDFNTAVADIVDNSIAASASLIKIAVGIQPGHDDVAVAISDNGAGMSMRGLKNALTYGSSVRSDEHSLGKFGLGLKTASTSQCRRLTVVSRKRGVESKLVLDIDHAETTGKWEYIEDDISKLERRYLDQAGTPTHGTVVIWTNCDRLMGRSYKNPGTPAYKRALTRKVDRLRFHLSMVFQRFLDPADHRAPTVGIVLNGTPLKPYDPFAQKLGRTVTTFEGAKQFDLFENESIVKAHAYVVPSRDELQTDEEIFAVFPKDISPDTMQGFFIYREDRLIHWGDWCGIHKNEFHYRLCRIDISFDSKLDDRFSVDFQKSKITLDPDISDWLKDTVIVQARKLGDERYREGSTKRIAEKAPISHVRSNRSISKIEKEDPEQNIKVTDLGENIRKISTTKGRSFVEVISSESKKRIKANIRPVESLPNNALWEAGLFMEEDRPRTYVAINTSHPFYQHAYYTCKGNTNAIRCLDYLIWSLAKAEYSTKDEESRENYQDMIIEVSRTLRMLAEDLPQDED